MCLQEVEICLELEVWLRVDDDDGLWMKCGYAACCWIRQDDPLTDQTTVRRR